MAPKLSWFNRIVAILIGHIAGTLIFIAGPIGVARLQGHTAADAMWMLASLPQFFIVILTLGLVPALLLALLFLRTMPAMWLAIVIGVVVALWVMIGSVLWLAATTNIWEPVFLHTLLGAAVNQLLLTIVSGAVAGLLAWCYLMLTAGRPRPAGSLPASGPTRQAASHTIH
jgi:hypothetical protein